MVIAKVCEVMVSPMFWDDEEDDEFDASWNAWAITFYGYIPRYDKESEGNLTLTNDGILRSIEWKFPKMMAEGWKAVVYANKKPLLEIDLAEEHHGRAELMERLVLMKGSNISARIFYIHCDDDFVPATVANHNYGQGYSMTLSGVQQGDDIIFRSDFGDFTQEESEGFTKWQIDMA